MSHCVPFHIASLLFVVYKERINMKLSELVSPQDVAGTRQIYCQVWSVWNGAGMWQEHWVSDAVAACRVNKYWYIGLSSIIFP